MYKPGMLGLVAVLATLAQPGAPASDPFLDPGPAIAARSVADALTVKDRTWEWKGRIARGDAIEIKGINGAIHAKAGAGDQVEVKARLHGKKSEPGTVEMVVKQHDGGVTICAVYPGKSADEPNECRPGGAGHMRVSNNDVTVEFTVSVPAGVNFIGRTVNGGIEASDLAGDVRAYTVNGDVDITTAGLAKVSTVNGSITVSMERADWDGRLEFSTTNGNVTLEMPADLSCDVSMSLVNGNISSDFPLTVEGRFSPKRLEGTIGAGGRRLVIKTVNGNIRLRRA